MAGKIKRAIYFTLDALFAAVLIGMALVLSSKYFIFETTQPQVSYYSSDIINSLSNIKISELNDTYIEYLISSGQIINLDNSVIEQIGEFYVLNQTDLAVNLSVIVGNRLIPQKYGFEMLINNESFYFNDSEKSRRTELISSRRLISGIEKFKPLKGATSKVFLEGINRKKYSSYIFFGGFIGQGNVSAFTESLPSGINISEIYLEMDAGSDFSAAINSQQCGTSFTAGTGIMTADGWNITQCKDSIVLGAKNNFSISFSDSIDTSYIGGGFIRIDYYTDQLQQEKQIISFNESLPEINGIINLYSSFYVPGSLNNISVFLHYYVNASNETNNTFYFSIANSTVFKDTNLSGEKNHTITDSNITKYLELSYLDSKTVPIRAGFENVSFGYIYEGNADVALITDLSGSMDWEMGSNSNGQARNCDNINYNNSDTSRLSVAKCLDKQFTEDIINITGNRVGLVSYNNSVKPSDTRYPSTDSAMIEATIGNASPQTGYDATGNTCICCGINSGRDILIQNVSRITLVASGASWKYNNFSFSSVPGQDISGNEWYSFAYANESQWHTGNAILGTTNGYSYTPAVTTEIGSSLVGSSLYPNLWEHGSDTSGPPNDFSSNILNTTGNTFGITGNDDGWDSQSNTYTYSGSVRFDNVSSQRLQIYTYDNNQDVSGAYGIEINITQAMYDIAISSNSRATLSFNYYWAETGDFESNEDQVWIKGRWTSPTSGSHWLGSGKDSGTSDPDNYYEIDVRNDPDDDITNGFFSQDMLSWIEGPGFYYLDFGGKLLRDSTNEEGYFRFDNIQLEITNATDHYYFRKNFTISDLSLVRKGVLNVMSDDRAAVYLNGELIDEDLAVHNASTWNRIGKNIPGDKFRQGTNVIAVEMLNSEKSAKFDLELFGLNDSRDRAMMAMTDGQANVECGEQGTTGDLDKDGSSDTASDDAIQAACDARSDYGITVYAVGVSDEADEPTLDGIAVCGDGIYAKSNNVTVLQEYYQDIASTIISTSRHAQTIEVEGNLTASILYGDSYIRLDYTPVSEPPQFGEISIITEEKGFDNCTFNVYIPPQIRVSDAKLTTYSSEHWSDALIVNSNQVFNLSEYSEEYTTLGDPFVINIPSSILLPGNNSFYIRTGDSPENSTDCSLNNTLIYTAQVKASVSYSDVLEKALGCEWVVEFDDGDNTTIDVPQGYSGSSKCYYTGESISYNQNDTYDDAMFRLFDILDFDDDGRIYVNIKQSNLIVGAISVGQIPYPWGPAIAEVRVWK